MDLKIINFRPLAMLSAAIVAAATARIARDVDYQPLPEAPNFGRKATAKKRNKFIAKQRARRCGR